MTMTGDAFVDTNILLRAFNSTFSEHPQVRSLFDRMLDQDYELWINRQVIREYLVQMTHPRTFQPPLTIEQVLNQLATVKSLFRIADDTSDVTAQLEALLLAYPTRGKQIHDANVVATMLAHNVDILLTLNLEDFRRFEDRITILTPDTAP